MRNPIPLAGTIYFIRQVGGIGPVKIGASRRSGLERLTDFQPGCPVPLELLGSFSGNCRDEKALHIKYAHLREHNEWFTYHPDLEKYFGFFGGQIPPPSWLIRYGHKEETYRANRGVQVPELYVEGETK